MKSIQRIMRGALVSAALTALVTVGASAQGIGTAIVYDNGLRLRTEASLSAAVLDSAHKGDTVTLLEDAGDNWYRVSFQGQEGFMFGGYLVVQLNDGTTKAPSNTAPAEAQAEAAPAKAAAQPVYGRITSGPLNVRAQGNVDADKLGQLGAGAVVKLLAQEGGWYQIPYQEGTAWVCGDFVQAGIDPNASTVGQQAVDLAMQYMGCRYVYGAAGPSQFDCSGLTSYVYRQLGYSLNRSAAGQTQNGTPVSRGELQAGDLVLFRHAGSSKAATHVGIYIGGDQFIHAASTDYTVRIDSLNTRWYAEIFIGGRHIA